MKLLFVDNDGVLNRDGDRHENGYSPLHERHVKELNRILATVPDLQIVVSSAWRYHVHNGEMTIKGLEGMYLCFGLNCRDRIHGITDRDPGTFNDVDHKPPFDREYWKKRGMKWRTQQIIDYSRKFSHMGCVAIDDLPLDLMCLVQTTEAEGLTAEIADEVIGRLQ